MSNDTTALTSLAENVRRALVTDPELRSFLLARITERRAEVYATYPDGDMRRGSAEVGFRLREFMAGMPLASQKAQAERFANHPDYRPEWKP